MSHFDYDALICHVTNLKTGTDHHGDDERLAVDVKLQISKAENGKDWPAIIVDLYGDQDDALETLEKTAVTVPDISFDREHDDYKINFRQSTKVLASLSHAKLSKFSWEITKGAESVSMNIHAPADGKTIGQIAEHLHKKIRLEVVSHQSELDLDDDQPDGSQKESEPDKAPA